MPRPSLATPRERVAGTARGPEPGGRHAQKTRRRNAARRINVTQRGRRRHLDRRARAAGGTKPRSRSVGEAPDERPRSEPKLMRNRNSGERTGAAERYVMMRRRCASGPEQDRKTVDGGPAEERLRRCNSEKRDHLEHAMRARGGDDGPTPTPRGAEMRDAETHDQPQLQTASHRRKTVRADAPEVRISNGPGSKNRRGGAPEEQFRRRNSENAVGSSTGCEHDAATIAQRRRRSARRCGTRKRTINRSSGQRTSAAKRYVMVRRRCASAADQDPKTVDGGAAEEQFRRRSSQKSDRLEHWMRARGGDGRHRRRRSARRWGRAHGAARDCTELTHEEPEPFRRSTTTRVPEAPRDSRTANQKPQRGRASRRRMHVNAPEVWLESTR